MADAKITDLTALAGASIASGDEFVIVDVSDTTMAATGTDKKTTANDVATAVSTLLGLGTLATKSTITTAEITDGTITTTDISGSAGITNAQLATEAQSTIKGRAAAAGTGAVTDLTATQVRTILDTNTTPSTQAIGDSATVGTADTLARGDHKHAMPAFASPTVVLGSSAATGSAATLIRSDATIAAFDATSPTTQAVADAAVVGTAAFAARRDHKHAWPSAQNFLDSLTGGSATAGNINSNVNTVAATGSTETLDTTLYAVHDCTMDQNCTFTFSNPGSSGKNTTFVLILRGAFTPTFPAAVKWPDGAAPTYSTPTIYTFTTVNAGTTWYGQSVGKAFA